MLEHFGAEASVLDMTIIVRSNPSKAAILEEFLHGTQEKLGIAVKIRTLWTRECRNAR
ncbi:hypothetical protein VEE48_28600 [Escherichia coli]|nr:hypothetical protein VEE48_28600 [Escherichia coli]